MPFHPMPRILIVKASNHSPIRLGVIMMTAMMMQIFINPNALVHQCHGPVVVLETMPRGTWSCLLDSPE